MHTRMYTRAGYGTVIFETTFKGGGRQRAVTTDGIGGAVVPGCQSAPRNLHCDIAPNASL